MRRLADGDVGALSQCYDSHVALVCGIAQRILGNRDPDVEDVVQVTFLNLWRAASTYQSGSLTGLIARIARNVAIDTLRRRREIPYAAIDVAQTFATEVDRIVFDGFDRASVRAALAELPFRERSPIELGFFEGLTHMEIAERTNVPLGTVKTRIRTGLRRLSIALAATRENLNAFPAAKLSTYDTVAASRPSQREVRLRGARGST